MACFQIHDGQSGSQDEQLKTDINAIRSALFRSGYRTRFAVILISDKSILHAPELEDRMANIRRATALDLKTGLFFMPPMSSQVEVSIFVQTVLATLQPTCVEYYRDLTKHARRKKARGGPPPQHNNSARASQVTPVSGWNVRYEVKQGVFAEFRQEMDVAERHYSTAIEELFSSEGGVLETTNSWSPRWHDARLLCDAVAMRVIRCQIWNNQPTAAVQSWVNYKLRMRDLVDRRGKGANTYGWDAWEARWAQAMSQLVRFADVPTLQKSFMDDAGQFSPQQIFWLPERSLAQGDRVPPFHFLHHPGYWLRLFAEGIRSRWARALEIPEEDRIPPDRSPASSVANRSKNYDLYLVPDPHEEAPGTEYGTYDHAAELGAVCLQAAEAFEARRQVRMSEQIRLELADDFVRAGRYQDALKVLVQLWEESTWRGECWSAPFRRLLQLLAECANRDRSSQNAALIPVVTWELLSIAAVDDQVLDLTQCLDTWDIDERIELQIYDKHRLSPISATFAFRDRESHVGEPLDCQLMLTNKTSTASSPIQISKLQFHLGDKSVIVRHNDTIESAHSSTLISDLAQAREMDDGTLETSANLKLPPSQKHVLNISLFLREAQVSQMTSLTLYMETAKFTLTHELMSDAVQPGTCWYLEKQGCVESILLPHLDTKSVIILPKPPKMQVLLHGLRKQYYTDEIVRLGVQLINDETEAVHATLRPNIVDTSGTTIPLSWGDSGGEDNVRSIDDMQAAASQILELVIQAPPESASFTLTLDLKYTVSSDPNAPLTKTVTMELPFVMPFEAKFTFAPRLHADQWPSYFEPSTCGVSDDTPDGIPQLWKLGIQTTSRVDQPLQFSKLELQVHEVQGDVICDIRDAVKTEEQDLEANDEVMAAFEIATRKLSLDDRRPSYLELSLVVTWSHSALQLGSSSANQSTTIIAAPRLTIPTSEPRVLCTAISDPTSSSADLHYHLENPSTHFLTFALTMEASEDFAFSGPKYRTLSLAPLSRHRVDYRIALHKELGEDESGVWVSPNLQVVDSYYSKNLRVHPGVDHMRTEGKGGEIAVWLGRREPPS